MAAMLDSETSRRDFDGLRAVIADSLSTVAFSVEPS